MGHCTMPSETSAPARAQDPSCPPEHAAMGHCAPGRPQQPAPDPHAGHSPSRQPTQPDPHAGHPTGHSAALPPAAPPPPEAFSGPEHAQDTVYDHEEAAQSRAELLREHGGLSAYRFLIDRLEAGFRNGREAYSWDAEAWYGGDINKLWVKTEGEGEFGGALEAAEVQALWSRAIDPWFDVQLGVRHDFRPDPERTHLVLGFQGLAPYWFEVDGALFLSTKGEVTARFEVEYDLRLTQHLILQPRAELDASLQDVPEIGIGSGVSTGELGARLRYDFFPESGPAVVAPYVGVQYERAFGDTASFRRADGSPVGGIALVMGVRAWF